MDAKQRVLGALEDLQNDLPRIAGTLLKERLESLQIEIAALCDDVNRAGSESEWEALEDRLDALRERYGLPQRASSSEDDDGFEVSPMRGGSPFGLLGMQDHATRGRKSAMALTAGLRRLVRVDKPAPIITYPSIEVPEEVVEQTLFRLEVTARAQPAGDAQEKVVLARDREGPVDLEVEVELPADGSITARSQLVQPLRVPEHGDSATLVFQLFAAQRGRRSVAVRFRHLGLERVVLHRYVGVVAAEEAKVAPPIAAVGRASTALGGSGEPFAGLLLRVTERSRDHEARYLTVALEGPIGLLAAPAEGLQPVSIETSELLAKLCHRMDEAMTLRHDDDREMRLTNVGAELAGKLLPRDVRDALAGAPEGTALHVAADDAWVPWEMLWLHGAGFLGERFALTRWLSRASLWDRLPGGRAILVAPPDSRLVVDAERTSLAALCGAPPDELRRVGEVMKHLAAPEPIGFLHFACHGRTPPREPLGGLLELEDGEWLRHSDVRDPDVNGGAAPLTGACVFLNACEGAITEHALSGHGGWAEVLLRARAGAVIAPLWSVKDTIAGAFAKSFYDFLLTGETVGEAARRTRVAVRRTGDPDRVAYAVYASPFARLARRPPPPR